MDLEREYRILRTLFRSSGIIDCYELYESSRYYILVMEYMGGGELLDVLIKRIDKGKDSYNEAELALIMLQVGFCSWWGFFCLMA